MVNTPMTDRSKSFREKLLRSIEKNRFSLSTGLIYLFIIGTIRTFLQARAADFEPYLEYFFAQHITLKYFEILAAGPSSI